MHGQMGNVTTTIKQLKIMRVEDDCIIIRGNVPGKKGNLIRVAPAKVVGKNCQKIKETLPTNSRY